MLTRLTQKSWYELDNTVGTRRFSLFFCKKGGREKEEEEEGVVRGTLWHA